MIIAQISDTHIAVDSADAAQRISDFERTIADINGLDPPADVIVHTGDIVHNGQRDEYACAAAMLAQARAPVYVLAGNKDDRPALREAFRAGGYLPTGFDFIQYAIDEFPVRLLALDTLGAGNRGDFCRDRVRHLTDMLEADAARPVAVFTHHPPFEVTVGPDPIHFESPDAMAELARTLQRAGRVAAIFSGHVHRAAAGDVAGIPASVMPSIATNLRKGDYPPHIKMRPVYHVHRFDAERSFATQARIVGAKA